MEKIEFDMKQIMQTQIDKTVLQMSTSAIAAMGADSSSLESVRDCLMVFINKGIPLTTALDIILEITKIMLKTKGGEEKNG